MAVPETVGEKFAALEVVESQSAVLKAACQQTSREGWPGVRA